MRVYLSYSLDSLKGIHTGDYIGDYHRAYQGGYFEFLSLDYSTLTYLS